MPDAGKSTAAAVDSSYLLAFGQSSSWLHPLPDAGEVVIGRREEVGIQIPDPSVSRDHARLVIRAGDVVIHDLGSQNGTFVNGARVQGERSLVSGDTIACGSVTLVFHAGARRPSPFVEFSELRRRLDEALGRSERFHRASSVVAVQILGSEESRAQLADFVATQLRRVDAAAWDGPDRILVLLAETDEEGLEGVAGRLLGALRAGTSTGFASYPRDGCDVDTLLASARAAAAAASAGEMLPASAACRVLDAGDQRILIADPAMARMFDLLERLARSELPVLILGETGSGKGVAAATLHAWSGRASGPLVTLNCAAIPEALVESELFGHGKGAFSGADRAKPGLLETADGGTFFLDEIGDLPLPAQAKLLRVLEAKRIRPVGEVGEREIDVRIVAATNRDLEEEVREGRFRRDLFFRLKGASVWIPPLRDRKREISVLAETFLNEACSRADREPATISREAMQMLTTYPWPGNVREMQSLMEYVATVNTDPVVEPRHLASWMGDAQVRDTTRSRPQAPGSEDPSGGQPLREEVRRFERSRIEAALEATGGNRTKAAQLLGVPLRTFMAKLKQHQI